MRQTVPTSPADSPRGMAMQTAYGPTSPASTRRTHIVIAGPPVSTHRRQAGDIKRQGGETSRLKSHPGARHIPWGAHSRRNIQDEPAAVGSVDAGCDRSARGLGEFQQSTPSDVSKRGSGWWDAANSMRLGRRSNGPECAVRRRQAAAGEYMTDGYLQEQTVSCRSLTRDVPILCSDINNVNVA